MEQETGKCAPKKLIIKLAEITESVKRIPKNGVNKFHGYRYMTESDIKEVVREEMSKRKIFIYGDEINNEKSEVTTKKGGIEFQIKITKIMHVVDGESGETISFKATGVGQDAGDKAQYKAETGLIKYVLNNLFLIPSGDDPEKSGHAPLQPLRPELVTDLQIDSILAVVNSLMEIEGRTKNEWLTSLNEALGINKDLKNFDIVDYGNALNTLTSWKKAYEKKAGKSKENEKRAWD